MSHGDVFISYAHGDDEPFVGELYKSLTSAGLSVWWDRESMPSRALTFHHEIRLAIDDCDRVLLVLSPLALQSDYVGSEWQYALTRGSVVVTVLRNLDPARLPEELRDFHAVRAPDRRDAAEVHAETLRVLRQPAPPLAPALGIPPPPPHFLPRADIERLIADRIVPGALPPKQAAAAPRALALFGMSGSGKSTIAAAFASSIRTRRAFSSTLQADQVGLPAAILWIRCGPEFQPVAAAQQALQDLEVPPGAPAEAMTRLKAAVDRRTVLFVLDDVRSVEDAQPFVQSCGPGCRVLLTTLNAAIATDLGALELPVDVLPRAQSLKVLQDWTGGAALPPQADEVAEKCGDLPFALAVVGALVADGQLWSTILNLFNDRDLESLKRKFPNYPHPHLLRALDAAVAILSQDEPEAARRYLELTVFREHTAVPEATIVRLWSRDPSLSAARAAMLLPLLDRRSLLRLKQTPAGRWVTLHTLQFDYVRRTHPDSPGLHSQLVDAYREHGGDAWSEGPDDGYYFQNLAYHLAAAERYGDLRSLISREWMQTRQAHASSGDGSPMDVGQAGLAGFVRDVEIAWQAALAHGPVQVANLARLYVARLLVHETASAYEDSYLEALVALRRDVEAIALAKHQYDAERRFDRLLKIYRWIAEYASRDSAGGEGRARLLPVLVRDLEQSARQIEDDMGRAAALGSLGSLLLATDVEAANRCVRGAEHLIGRLHDGRVHAYRDLAERLAEAGDSRAREFIRRAIDAAGADRTFLQVLSEALAHPALGDEIAGFVEKARTLDDADTRDYLIAWACHALVALRRFDEAETIIGTIADPGHRSTAASNAARALGERDRPHALRILHDAAGVVLAAPKGMWSATAVGRIAAELARLGDPDADALFGAAERAVQETRMHPSNRALVLSELAILLVDGGHVQRGQAIARSIGDTNLHLQMDPRLATGLAAAGRHDEAVRVARSIPRQHTKDSVLATLASTLAEGREFDQAERVIASMGDVLSAKRGAIADLARALVGDRQVDRAIGLAHRIPPSAERAELLAFLATTLAKAGDTRAEECLKLAEDTTYDMQVKRAETHRDEAAAEVANALAQLKRFRSAEEVARRIASDQGKALALVAVASAQKEQAPKRAARLFDEAEELSRNAPVSPVRRQFLHDISVGESRNLVDRNLQKMAAYRKETLATRLVEVGEFARAEKLAGDLGEAHGRADVLNRLAAAMVKARHRGATKAIRNARAAARASGFRRRELLTELATLLAEARPKVRSRAASAQTASAIPTEADPSSSLLDVAGAHASTGKLKEAFVTLAARPMESLGEGEHPLDDFVKVVAEWTPSLERAEPGLALMTLREVTEVASWLRPDWLAIHQLLPQEGRSSRSAR